MPVLFIDGQEGTTGLEILQRLKAYPDWQILSIPSELRKDPAARAERLNACDIAVLCLPDAAAKEAVSLIENPHTRVLDASTAHRVEPGWAYGFPELKPDFRKNIAEAMRVANPGCYASGFISLVRPLRQAGLLSEDDILSCFAVSGYSGGGKKMIAQYEADPRDDAVFEGARIYGLTQSHKHIPEMMKYGDIKERPLFAPMVVDAFRGMLVNVPFQKKGILPGDIREIYAAYYEGEKNIGVLPEDTAEWGLGGMLDASAVMGTDRLEIGVSGREGNILLSARLDNLGKGASGAAVQNLRVMLGEE